MYLVSFSLSKFLKTRRIIKIILENKRMEFKYLYLCLSFSFLLPVYGRESIVLVKFLKRKFWWIYTFRGPLNLKLIFLTAGLSIKIMPETPNFVLYNWIICRVLTTLFDRLYLNYSRSNKKQNIPINSNTNYRW